MTCLLISFSLSTLEHVTSEKVWTKLFYVEEWDPGNPDLTWRGSEAVKSKEAAEWGRQVPFMSETSAWSYCTELPARFHDSCSVSVLQLFRNVNKNYMVVYSEIVMQRWEPYNPCFPSQNFSSIWSPLHLLLLAAMGAVTSNYKPQSDIPSSGAWPRAWWGMCTDFFSPLYSSRPVPLLRLKYFVTWMWSAKQDWQF